MSVVRVRVADGRRLLFVQRANRRRVQVAGVGAHTRATITVAALRPNGLRGRPATTTLPAKPKTPHRHR